MKRIPSLDGLRAIAIAAVVVGHVAKALHSTAILGAYGNTGVRIFFVISGYLITRLLISERDRTSSIRLRDFYVRRAYRILPAALVFVAAAVIIDWHQMRWYHVAAAVFYVANCDYSLPWIFGHLWSLSVEEQFYLLWPGVLKHWYKRRVAISIGVVLFAPVLNVLLYYFKVPAGGDGLFPVVADNLAVGCLLAMLESRIPRIPGYVALAMTLAIFFIPFYPARTVTRTLFMVFVLHPAFLMSIAGVILHVVRRPYRFLNCRPVVWLGQISYSLYLWQEPFCPNPRFRPGYAIAFAIAAACISYYAIERPALNMRDKGRKENAKKMPEAHIAGAVQPARCTDHL
jgi:peptidoglycan/LPS O-acetylase OafA/YrhL